jgi:hypothetical protein
MRRECKKKKKNLPSLSIFMRYNAFVYWKLCSEVEDEEENYFFEEGLFSKIVRFM